MPVTPSPELTTMETQNTAAKTRTTLITGGARGIGAAIARKLGETGHRIAICDVDRATMDDSVAQMRSDGIEALAVEADLASPGAANAVIDRVEERWGPVEILVNNAGITRDGLLVRMSDDDFNTVLAINLVSAFALSRRSARAMMKARWGRIVNISSVVALMGNAGQANYVAAKAGLIGLTKTLALELAPRGITVNAVAPGFIATGMTARLPEAVVADYQSRIPLGRFGAPEDVAGVVAFLCSEVASYMTGQTLRVDGGMVMA
ncbi:MAG TPA: 3-oxoacyl-[acyl-carrier-protein] reductase [Acidobacteriota bacterium]|nr:3-oxoacyl-[acyl-carrier-protein] reductase [Acidobacteriota bacterium]